MLRWVRVTEVGDTDFLIGEQVEKHVFDAENVKMEADGKKPARSEPTPRTLDEAERQHILAVLEQCNGNQTLAAEVLDIDRVTLHNKLKKYGWKRITADVL